MSAKSSKHSNLHSKCRHGPREPKSDPPHQKLTTKPFCDCKDCACKSCPDILKMLSITVTEKSCDFGSKGKKCCTVKLCPENSQQELSPRLSSILDVMKDRDCSCDVVARALRSNLHMNMGLTDRRETINSLKPTPKLTDQTNKPSQSNQREPPK